MTSGPLVPAFLTIHHERDGRLVSIDVQYRTNRSTTELRDWGTAAMVRRPPAPHVVDDRHRLPAAIRQLDPGPRPPRWEIEDAQVTHDDECTRATVRFALRLRITWRSTMQYPPTWRGSAVATLFGPDCTVDPPSGVDLPYRQTVPGLAQGTLVVETDAGGSALRQLVESLVPDPPR